MAVDIEVLKNESWYEPERKEWEADAKRKAAELKAQEEGYTTKPYFIDVGKLSVGATHSVALET